MIKTFPILLLCAGISFAEGISTPFVDVLVLDVPLGEPRLVEDKDGQGLVLNNLNQQPLSVEVKVLIPRADQLRGGAEPLPDPSWIQIVPDQLEIPAGQSNACAVKILIPNEKRFRHRYYQAMIWTKARPPGTGIRVSMGLLSRLRLRTSK